MNYTLELAPELEAQLHALAAVQHKNETDILLAAVREYLLRLSEPLKDPVEEEWLDYGEEMWKELP
jgi:predicted transcriptional regulator